MQLIAIERVGGLIPGRPLASHADQLQTLFYLALVQPLLSTNF